MTHNKAVIKTHIRVFLYRSFTHTDLRCFLARVSLNVPYSSHSANEIEQDMKEAGGKKDGVPRYIVCSIENVKSTFMI